MAQDIATYVVKKIVIHGIVVGVVGTGVGIAVRERFYENSGMFEHSEYLFVGGILGLALGFLIGAMRAQRDIQS